MIALDLSAAFDTANHKILFRCPGQNIFGIQRTSLEWINSYLTNRQFHVQIEDQFYDVKTID